MGGRAAEVVAAIARVRDPADFGAPIALIERLFGVKRVVFIAEHAPVELGCVEEGPLAPGGFWARKEGLFLVGDYPRAWIEKYCREDYAACDPVMSARLGRATGYGWSELDWSDVAAARLREEAVAYGVGPYGFSAPIHGPTGERGLLTVASTEEAGEWRSIAFGAHGEFGLIAAALQQRTLQMLGAWPPSMKGGLTPLTEAETAALSLLAAGEGHEAAAARLGVTERAFRARLARARRRLGARTATQAVALATRRGWLDS